MGSKQKLLPYISDALSSLDVESVLDPFSGSGCVAHMLKGTGRRVVSGDILEVAYIWGLASVENNGVTLSAEDIDRLLEANRQADDFIQRNFADLYFSQPDNVFLDNFSANVRRIRNPYKRAIALAAVTRACLKKRPRGVFTYVGARYDDGRSDLRKSLEQHYVEAVGAWNDAVFDNNRDNRAYNAPASQAPTDGIDLAYLDPPYFSTKSDNDYTRRYHFIEGLVSYWERVEIQWHTKTNKIVGSTTPFQHRKTVYSAFAKLFEALSNQHILLSYSSNCLPTRDEMVNLFRDTKHKVEVLEIPHTYTFGTHAHKPANLNNRVREFLFIAKPR